MLPSQNIDANNGNNHLEKKRNAFRVCYRARVENYFKERYWNLKRGRRGEGRKFLEIRLEKLYSATFMLVR